MAVDAPIADRLAKHNARMIESTWSQDEAIAWAKKEAARTQKWPLRRWRVETPAGNTRLLTKKAAERSLERYSGRLVELIPTPTALGLPAMTLNQTRTEGLPACPKCKAEVGYPCRTPGKDGKPGGSRPPHAERVEAGKPPAPPLPTRGPIHDGKPPHTACPSPMTCDCNCRLCRRVWKDAKKPGRPKPPARTAAKIVRSDRDLPDEPNDPGLPPGGFA